VKGQRWEAVGASGNQRREKKNLQQVQNADRKKKTNEGNDGNKRENQVGLLKTQMNRGPRRLGGIGIM